MSSKIKYFIVSLFFLGSFYSVFSQSNLLNAKDPSQIGERELYEIALDPDDPLAYGRVEDKHILFSKMVWEEIDVSQRVNFPYLYPVDSTVIGKERRPLIYYIKKIAERTGEKSIPIYEDDNGEFNLPMNEMARDKIWRSYSEYPLGTDLTNNFRETIEGAIYDGDLSWPLNVPATSHPEKSDSSLIFLKNDSDGNPINEVITEEQFYKFLNEDDDEQGSLNIDGSLMSEEDTDRMDAIIKEIIIDTYFLDGEHYEWDEFEWEDVMSWKIKGLWYFDNLQSELKYRIIGIAPVTIPVGLVEIDSAPPGSINTPTDNTNEICTDPITKEVVEDCYCEDANDNQVPCDKTIKKNALDGNKILEDGRTVNAQSFEKGKEFYIVTGDQKAPMPTGEYILEDGRTIVVLEEGIIDDVIEFADETQNDETKVEENIAKPLFWIFYPQIRKDLAKAYVFSERNSAVRKSFDELINSRRFDAVIYREENVYEDITLEDKYPKSSFMRLIESERIKEKIRNLEHDMWSW